MRILYDGGIFKFQKTGGINRYFSEIISALPADWTPVVTGVRDFGRNAPRHSNLESVNPRQFRPGRLRNLYNASVWRPGLARGVQLLHPTYYDLTSGWRYSDFKCPVVTTAHDFIYARFPRETDGAAAVIESQLESIRRAAHIVCVSQSTERDLLEIIPQAAGKTSVIYHGSSFAVSEPKPESEIFARPTFLFVGGRIGYKNFLMLLRAFAKAGKSRPDIHLKVVGTPLNSEDRWQIHFLGLSDRVTSIVFPQETELEQLYRNSVALLYPSRYEGFGIPPLEAMASGTVAVTTNVTSLPEVVGDGGIMLDPADEDAWADCIIKLARPFPERPELLKRARSRAQQFSWAKCAAQHLEIYKKLT